MTDGPSSAGIHARPISSAPGSRGTHRVADSLDVDVIVSSQVSASERERRSRRRASGDGADPARAGGTGQSARPLTARERISASSSRWIEIYSTSERSTETIEELSRSPRPVATPARRTEPSSPIPMSPTTSLGAGEVTEGSRDAHDLVELEDTAPDHHHEQIAGDAGGAGLRGVGHEGEAAGRVAVREPGEMHASAVGGDGEDLRALTIGEEDCAAGPWRQPLGHRALEHASPLSTRRHAPKLAGPGLPWRLGVPIAGYPEMVRLVDGEDARARDAHVGRIEHLPARVQAQHHPALPIGHEDRARTVDGAALWLYEEEGHAFCGRATRQELGAPVVHAVERAHTPSAIERRDEEIASAPAAPDLGIDERRPVEVAGLRRRGDARPARGNAIERSQVLVLAAAVATPRSSQIEYTLVIDHEGTRGGNAAAWGARGRLETLAGDVDAKSEPGREEDVRGGHRRPQAQPESRHRCHAPRSREHMAAIVPEGAWEVNPGYTRAHLARASETAPWIRVLSRPPLMPTSPPLRASSSCSRRGSPSPCTRPAQISRRGSPIARGCP